MALKLYNVKLDSDLTDKWIVFKLEREKRL